MKYLNLDTDSTLGGDNASDSVIPSQRAIKTYVDNAVPHITVESDAEGDVVLSTAGIDISDDGSGNIVIEM